MRPITPTEPTTTSADAVPATLLAQSALQLTRDAIARWSGSACPSNAPARDVFRVSPQARWLAQTQCGLAAWIERGGFAQGDQSAGAPVMYDCGATLPRTIGAFID